MIQFIKKLDSPTISIIFLYIIFSLLSPSNKVFFLVSTGCFLLLTFSTLSIQKTLIYLFYPFYFFEVGQKYIFNVVPPEMVKNPLYWEGRNFTFTFSPFTILCITQIIIFIIYLLKKRKDVHFHLYDMFFFLVFLLQTLSSFFSPYFKTLSLLYSLIDLSIFIWYLNFKFFLKKEENIQKILLTFLIIILSLLCVDVYVSTLQKIKGSTLGLTIEKIESLPSFGTGADENKSQIRPVGLRYHANDLANWTIIFFFSILLLWSAVRRNFSKHMNIIFLSFLVSLNIGLISLTLSRSAYIALFVFLCIVFFTLPKKLLTFISVFLKRVYSLRFFILLMSFFIVYMVTNRFLYSLYSFTETGGIQTRKIQIQEALGIIQRFPYLGVGNGMFISASFDLKPFGVMQYFPEEIHNGFLLFLAERGIVTSILYMIGLYFLIRKIVYISKDKVFKIFFFGGIIANIIMMLFQPFINTFSLTILTSSLVIQIYEIQNRNTHN